MSESLVARSIAAAAAWLNGASTIVYDDFEGGHTFDFVEIDVNHEQHRRNVAAWFVAAGSAAVGGAFAQSCFTTPCHAWLYRKGEFPSHSRTCTDRRTRHCSSDAADPLAERILRSWPLNAPGPATLELPGSCAADAIMRAAAECHPTSVRAVALPRPEAWHIASSTVETCVAAWMPQLREWRVAMTHHQTERTFTGLFGSGSPYLEALHAPCYWPGFANSRPQGRACGFLLEPAAAIAHPNLKRVTLYHPCEYGDGLVDVRALAALAPNLEVLETEGVNFCDAATGELDSAECLHLMRNLRRLGHVDREYTDATVLMKRLEADTGDDPESWYRLPPTVRDVSSYAMHGISKDRLNGLARAAAITIEGALVLHSPKAGARNLERYLPLFHRIQRLDLSFHLVSWGDHAPPTFSREMDDTCVAALLRDMPALTALDVGSADRYMESDLTFTGEAYRGVCAPGLRELAVARIDSLRSEGITTIVRVCPNLRALDLRGCRNVSRRDFVAAVVERCVAPAAVAGAPPQNPKQDLALRLRNLRRVVASFRWPLPNILNFVEYDPGFFGRKARNYAQGAFS